MYMYRTVHYKHVYRLCFKIYCEYLCVELLDFLNRAPTPETRALNYSRQCLSLKVSVFFVLYRDATNEMALHFLAKMKILVVQDIERSDVEFICRVSEA